MTVLVVGATGTVGPHVVRGLAARQMPARVLARDVGHAQAVLLAGTDIRGGDPAADDDLLAAADGAEALFLLSSHDHRMADLQLRIIRVLRRTGISIVKLSGTRSAINPDGPQACRQHWEIEHVLAVSGQPYAVLRPNAFMQTLIDQIMLPAVKATGAIPNPIGAAGISFIDARDAGECAATVLASWDGQTLVLTGPRAVSFAEIADLISARTGREVGTREITPADVRRQLEERGMARWEAEHFQEMYQLFRDGRSEIRHRRRRAPARPRAGHSRRAPRRHHGVANRPAGSAELDREGQLPMAILEASGHPGLFIRHSYPEQTADLGEITLNRATVGRADLLDTP